MRLRADRNINYEKEWKRKKRNRILEICCTVNGNNFKG